MDLSLNVMVVEEWSEDFSKGRPTTFYKTNSSVPTVPEDGLSVLPQFMRFDF